MKRGSLPAAVASAFLLTMIVACEEWFEPAPSDRPDGDDALRHLQRAVPKGIEVVRRGSSAGLDTYVLRNPGARDRSSRNLRVADTGVARRFDTPLRSARMSDGDLQFVEQASFAELHDAHERAHAEVARGQNFLNRYGDLLEVGGLDIEAVEEWVERQQGLADYMTSWLASAWPDHVADLLMPPATTRVSYLDGMDVLLEVSGIVGTALFVTLPVISGGAPPLTYQAGSSVVASDGTGIYMSGMGLPDGLTFNAATRTISGTPTTDGCGMFLYGAADSINRFNFAWVAWKIEPNPNARPGPYPSRCFP